MSDDTNSEANLQLVNGDINCLLALIIESLDKTVLIKDILQYKINTNNTFDGVGSLKRSVQNKIWIKEGVHPSEGNYT